MSYIQDLASSGATELDVGRIEKALRHWNKYGVLCTRPREALRSKFGMWRVLLAGDGLSALVLGVDDSRDQPSLVDVFSWVFP
jgi:hypothetical protein